MTRRLGVIGGSGIYEVPGLQDVQRRQVDTPFGSPSDEIVVGSLGEVALLFLPRHGRGHRIAPHRINYRANIAALKLLGATQVVSISAVGSMRPEIQPGHVVVPDQYLDLSRSRPSTFFEDDVVAHVAFGDPVCAQLAAALADAAERCGATVHRSGTYLCMEGPAFSTRAESLLYQSFGVSVIGMTAMPEAKLAREAELPYATLALATDYDAWHVDEADVSVQAVLAVLRANSDLGKRVLVELAPRLPDPALSPASRALAGAILTAPDAVAPEARARLGFLIDRYL